jgi:hypothetical protein
MSDVHAGYLKAYTIETPVDNDHVRFSLLVAIAIFTVFFLLTEQVKPISQRIRFLLLTLAVAFIIYLHVLAARTGLLCFYVGAFVYLVVHWHKRTRAIVFLLALFGLPFVAYLIFPTLKNKVRYFKYDISFVQNQVYLPGSSDGNRVASIKAGWNILTRCPFGVGFGDIRNETQKFYEINYSQMSQSDKILPSSEWLLYGDGIGWAGIISFSFVMLLPFFLRTLRKNIFWMLLNIATGSSLLFDIGLEVQFGVFIHAFILLWWYTWLQSKE